MPVQYNLPEYQDLTVVEDVDKYNKLPVYLAMQEARMFPEWQVYNQLFGKIPWSPNMGDTLRGVGAVRTPVGNQFFFPNRINTTPNKNVFENNETTNDAVLRLHDFDSKKFHFLPSFQDFRRNQLDFSHKDIVRQIAIHNDLFIRGYAFEKAPYVYVVGNTAAGEDALVSAPANPDPDFLLAGMQKDQAWRQATVAKIGAPGNLSLRVLDHAVAVMRDDIGAPFFEGTVNTPKDNELVKGRYCLIGSSEAYQQFKWDPDFSNFRNVNLSIVNNGFRGNIFDELTYKTERFPIRIAADGTVPEPELESNADNRVRPNPNYIAAPYEVAFLVGADAMQTVNVGPPPKEFTRKQMSMEKFYSMRWNGEVQLTDQVLVEYNDGGTTRYDTNVRGRFLKLISSVVFGGITNNQDNFMPIIFARKRAL